MTHTIPSSRSFLPNRILLQVYDADLGLGASQKSQSGKYQALRTRAQRELGSVNNLHHCRPSIAWLNNLKSRKRIPPQIFGCREPLPRTPMDIFLPFSTPHHWFARDLLMSSHVETGNIKQLMTYVGIA